VLWRRSETSTESWSEDLREQVRDRVRLVVEFATLGAYELTDEPAESQRDRAASCCHPAREHVALLSKAGCAHGADAERHCSSAPSRDRRRRPGQTRVPEQPCVW
jgi:hypothetical protein